MKFPWTPKWIQKVNTITQLVTDIGDLFFICILDMPRVPDHIKNQHNHSTHSRDIALARTLQSDLGMTITLGNNFTTTILRFELENK